MTYQLESINGNVSLLPLKPREVKEYTSKVLSDVETNKLDVLNYGRVLEVGSPNLDQRYKMHKAGITLHEFANGIREGDIVLYQKLAAHSTNFGDPRIVLVPIENIEGKLTPVEKAKKEAPND